MKTKALFLAGLVSLAGAAASEAQTVYSVNAVGFVNVPVLAGKYQMIANPLIKGGNTLNEVFSGVADGTALYIFNKTTGSYREVFYTSGIGWFEFVSGNLTPCGSTVTFVPGQGGFILSPSAVTFTFTGEVAQGAASNSSVSAGYQIISSSVPASLAISSLTSSGTGNVAFPAAQGDAVYRFDPTLNGGTGGFKEYFFDTTLGWFSIGGSGITPASDSVSVGESFFFLASSGTTRNWDRNFSVNN